MAPTEADSVGVAIPKNIEPRTASISKSGGKTVLNSCKKLKLLFSTFNAGATLGLYQE